MIRLAEVPVELGRDEAQRAARAELADPAYQAAQPGWFTRAVTWVADRIADFFAGLGGTPGGVAGLVLVLALVVVLVVVVRLRTGKLARPRRVRGAVVFSGAPRTAVEHRLAAERAQAEGGHAEAVREWFRAVVRELEERGVLDERSGRTAVEAAADAGRQLPGVAAELRAAATVFDDVHYGDRPASAEAVERLAALDASVRERRPVAR
ncbi:DUF4129 domain-containing protein [Prauserella cavernicola]|uniref:DUF4129 domain-containing protein n=1 Tax=Prauserella cavernicola TaxID=2800127 RepID=A0A934QYP3_9PSEU|nr:DUF4129 domain-containing protein [Prauserella cavernicola]MBK1788971.1 DUF4129 domain-containing protein [Prauserella cavernicola]